MSRRSEASANLNRFVEAQEDDYERALSEIVAGRKRTHWMWYIFPQIEGLGSSSISRHFSIKGVEEAEAYLDHPVLGPRLLKCAEAVVGVEGRSATEIFGSPDDLKLKSCATLFASVLPAGSVFDRVLAKYYAGARDEKTLAVPAYISPLTSADYMHRGVQEILGREFFRRGNPRAYHLHLTAIDSPFWRDHLTFRNRLRFDNALRDAYAELKLDLVARFPRDREAYIAARASFVNEVLGLSAGS